MFFRKNKYGAKRVKKSGFSFASKGESKLHDYLKLEEAAGIQESIQVQDHVYLTKARILYIADFKTHNREKNRTEWHEFKGFETDVWRIKRRLWKHYGPGILKVYKCNGGGIYLTEEIFPEEAA